MIPDYRILDNLLEGCQVIGFDWQYLYINEAGAKHGRKNTEELLNHPMMDVYPGIDQTALFRTLKRCMDERIPIDMENEFVYADGSRGWFELRIQPVPEGIFILSIDITGRKQAEHEIEQQLFRIQSLRAIDLAILGTTDLNLALKTVLQETRDRLHVDVVSVMLLDSLGVMLDTKAQLGLYVPGHPHLRVRLGLGTLGVAALNRDMVAFPNFDEYVPDDLAQWACEESLKALFIVPLVAKGRVVGVLNVGHRTPLDPPHDWIDFLAALAGQAAMAIDNGKSFLDLQRAHLDLALAYNTTIEGWSHALDLRDKETEGHSMRVTEMTIRLARQAGMSETEIVQIKRGALLHDIGKMGIPDAILLKPDRLTEEEWTIIRKHPVYAYEMLLPISYLRPALDIPYCHHEKWDGTGYPRGLKGDQIPLAARLFAVVDVWDALRSNRPYRPGWPEEKVLAHIQAQAGTHFDPYAVELFLKAVDEKKREEA